MLSPAVSGPGRDLSTIPSPTHHQGNIMHAVVVNVTIDDPDAAERVLHEQLVPRVSQLPGFVTGYWTIKDNTGLTMLVFETEAEANRMGEQAHAIVPPAMTFEGVEVREVAAHA
jgi:hypothetical protein